VKTEFDTRKSVVDNEAHKNREAKRAERVARTTAKGKGPARGIKFLDPEHRKTILEQWGALAIDEFDMRTQTQFFTKAHNVLDVIEEIFEYLDPECVPIENEEQKKEMESYDTDMKAKYAPKFDGEQLKFTYEFTRPWDTPEDEEDEEEEKDEAETPKELTFFVVVSALKADDKTHCIDFHLKKYQIDDQPATNRDNYEVRDRFLRHFHNLVSKKHVKQFNDASETEVTFD
jgi:chemotaxis protein histidine kinase CheA